MSGNTPGRVLKGEIYAHSVQKVRFSCKTEEKILQNSPVNKSKKR